MKYPSILIALFLFISSCGKDDSVGFEESLPEECKNGSCDFTYKEDAQIQDITEINPEESFQIIAQVLDGENLAFKYLYEKDDSPQIADDELTTELIFEAPRDQNSFSLSDEHLATNKALYRMICFCGKVSHQSPSSGYINGTRLSPNSWRITASLTIDYFAEFGGAFDPVEIQFDTVFRLE